MFLSWEELPMNMRTDAVRPYYEILHKKKTALRAKRIMDILLALGLTIVLSPIMLLIALFIKIEDRGPVFYRQERITAYGKRFKIYKFRTMVVNADKKGPLITGKTDSRITRMGQKLRKCRLDELPQLFNILAGDMSIVGTRPEVAKYVKCYTDEMKATLLLPAGVTSPASIAFKEEDELIAHYTAQGKTVDDAYVTYILPEKMRYNLKYLEEAGLFGDLRIMIKTVLEVLK